MSGFRTTRIKLYLAAFASALVLGLAPGGAAQATPPGALSPNLLRNPGFEARGTGPTILTESWVMRPSAAPHWMVRNNFHGTTTTELVPSTLPGGGAQMIHVVTTAPRSGLVQFPLPFNADPISRMAWVYVVRGQVYIGTDTDYVERGVGDYSASTGTWELVHGSTGIPARWFYIFSAWPGGAEFYVDNASVRAVTD